MIIRDSQIQALGDQAFDNFVAELCGHCRDYAPDLVGTLSEEELESAVRKGIDRAAQHGFDLRGPVRFYVELMIAFGAGFDTDSQYPWAAEVLSKRDEVGQMERAGELFAASESAFESIFGKDNVHSNKALKEMLIRIRDGIKFERKRFKQDMFALLKEIHPNKCYEIGDPAVEAVIADGIRRGRDRYGFREARSMALIIALMFALGHKFDADPFHPWISRTLEEETDGPPDDKAEELERRAVTWFEAALKNTKEAK